MLDTGKKRLQVLLILSLFVSQTQLSYGFSLFSTKPKDHHLQVKQTSTPQWEAVERSPFKAGVQKVETFDQSFPLLTWWQDWPDTDLHQIVKLSLSHNLTVDQSRLRVKESKAIMRQFLGNELPKIDLNPSIVRQKNSKNLIAPGQDQLNQSGNGGQIFSPGNTFTIYNAPVQASYELDLFFKNRLRTRGQKFLFNSQQAQYQSVMASVTGDVVSGYLNWRLAQISEVLQQQRVDEVKTQMSLNESLCNQGLIDYSVLETTQQLLLDNQRQLTIFKADQRVLQNQLALLCGQTPAEFQRTVAGLSQPKLLDIAYFEKLSKTLAQPKAGFPSALVSRRPDIISKESELLAAQVNVSLARRAFLPDITLNSSLSFTATKFAEWFTGDSYAWSAGGNLLQNIFNGGKKFFSITEKKATYDRLLSEYRQSILNAFKEVENALIQTESTETQLETEQQKYQSLMSEFLLMQSRYHEGLISYLPVSQQKLAMTEQQLSTSEKNNQLLQERISLIKSLGGGW